MQKLLHKFKRRLTNLSTGNRALVLLRLPMRQFIDLKKLEYALEKPAFSLIENLIKGAKDIKIATYPDPRDSKTNDIGNQLKYIQRTDLTLKEERGADDLYIGYPIVKGKMLDNTAVRCPLLYIPVELTYENNEWIINRREEEITLNQTFLLAYAHFNHIKLEDDIFNKSFEDFSSEPKVFLTELYEWLKSTPLKLNFNSELFETEIAEFEEIKKETLNEEQKGELKLFPQAILGLFQQTGSFLTEDYDQLIEEKGETELDLEELFHTESVEENIKEEFMQLPLPVDASQEEAIRKIKGGSSLVIQGPPGTGKSQLIANLMADYAAQGKKVLLVCQKRAAIDTVYNRLANIGMEKFTALVHDFQADRKDLFQKIAYQIEEILAYKHQNQSLNTIFLEREFDAASRRIDKTLRDLNEFKDALYDTKTYGKSIKELYLSVNHQRDKEIDLSSAFSSFHFDTLPEFLRKLDQLEAYKNALTDDTEAYVYWSKRRDFATYTLSDLQKIKGYIAEINKLKTQLKEIEAPFTQEVEPLAGLVETYRNEITEDSYEYFKHAAENPKRIEVLEKLKKQLEPLMTSPAVSASYAYGDLEPTIAYLEEQANKNSNFISSLIWKSFSKEKDSIQSHLSAFGLSFSKQHILQVKSYLEDQLAILNIGLEIGLQKTATRETILENLTTQIESHQLFHKIDHEGRFLIKNLKREKKEQFDTKVKAWSDLYFHKETQKPLWLEVLTERQIDQISEKNVHAITQYLEEQFDNLQARDALYDSLTEVEKMAYNLSNAAFESELSRNFERNLSIHFIEDLEIKNPALRNASSKQLAMLEAELQDNVLRKRKFSNDFLLVKLRENTYKNIEKNRLGNPTTYRDLEHQTTKKRQLWPIRKIVANFSHELFDLIPCWMASPETVSAIFPLADAPLFDLVIFDEASQCFAENGLPAMLRGKQVVVAGDNKQLRPNNLYRIKYEEETEDETLLEQESLLELASQFLPQHMLRGHYRSKSLDLIQFSNNAFYKNKLQLLPGYKHVNDHEAAIEYFNVKGQWKNNTNITEAEKVVELVKTIKIAGPDKSIGIVTFNFLQSDLIKDLLPIDSNVTVKNIENIQGDEYDIVLFSIGYGPDENGKINQQYGSLSQKDGENRLNVAITRAREKVIIISSILPEDLPVENTTNQGPKLLKAYLSYAKSIADRQHRSLFDQPNSNQWGESLYEQIKRTHPSLKDELPFADLVHKDHQQYEDLVLTDDHLFYEANAKEAFAYLPLTLAAKGWQFHRIWSRNWWATPSQGFEFLEEKPKKQ